MAAKWISLRSVTASALPKAEAVIRPGSEQAEFIGEVRDLFLAPACVRAVFTAADEAIASGLYGRGVSPEQVRRAILLGCARKYATMINSQTRTRISSLQYFVPLVNEVVESAIRKATGTASAKSGTDGKRWIQIPQETKRPSAPSAQL